MNDIHDIKPPISLDYISQGTVLAIVLVFCLILVSLIAWLIYRYMKNKLAEKKDEGEFFEQKIDYQEEARKRLDEISKKIDQKLFKEFHLEVALIIREFLSGQFEVEAIDMTSREILSLPQLSTEIKKELLGFFEMNDYSKFAGDKEEEGVAREVLDRGRKIINL